MCVSKVCNQTSEVETAADMQHVSAHKHLQITN